MSAPYIPTEMGLTIIDAIRRINDDPEIEVIVIAVKMNEPPSMVSSIPPDKVVDVLSFMTAEAKNVEVTIDSLGTKH